MIWTDVRRLIGWQPGPHGMCWIDAAGEETTREATADDLLAWLCEHNYFPVQGPTLRAALEAAVRSLADEYAGGGL